MTEQQFVDRWRKHLAGLALYGSVSELRDGPLVRASKILDIPDETEKLLRQMYKSMAPPDGKPLTQGGTNGVRADPARATPRAT